MAATSCPYANAGANAILVSNALCPTPSTPCLVNRTCSYLRDATLEADANGPGSYIASAVGDMSLYGLSTLTIQGSANSHACLASMVLPKTGLRSFQASYVANLKADFEWPSTLTSIKLNAGNTTQVPTKLPPSVTFLRWDDMGVHTIPSVLSTWTHLSLAGNPISDITNVGFGNLVYISLYNAPVARIQNVTFGSKLNYFAISGTLTSFVLAKPAYDILNSLTPASNYIGYEVNNFKTDLNTTACTRAGGVLQPLWAAPASYSVCVVHEATKAPTADPATGSMEPTLATLTPKVVPTTPAPTEDTSLNVVYSVSVGVAVVVLLIVGYCCWKRRNAAPRRSAKSPTTKTTITGSLPSSNAVRGADVDLDRLRLLRLEHHELVVVDDAPLAAGAHGEVWRGMYLQQPVAIKRTKDKSAKAITKMSAEILLLSRIDCPFIVHLVGASWTRPTDLECVVELMDLGDLRSFLTAMSHDDYHWDQKLTSIFQVAQGLMYLHTFETPIIHRDLKSRNVLLDSQKGTKLTDFGESREMDEETLTNGIGTYQWMAPEISTGHDYSTAADVYSFGVLLSEYSTHRVPYADMVNPRTNKPMHQQFIMHQVAAGELAPTFETETTPAWVVDLASQCLSCDPDPRPSMLRIASLLKTKVSS